MAIRRKELTEEEAAHLKSIGLRPECYRMVRKLPSTWILWSITQGRYHIIDTTKAGR